MAYGNPRVDWASILSLRPERRIMRDMNLAACSFFGLVFISAMFSRSNADEQGFACFKG